MTYSEAALTADYNDCCDGVRRLLDMRRAQLGREPNSADYSAERMIVTAIWQLDATQLTRPDVLPNPLAPKVNHAAEAALAKIDAAVAEAARPDVIPAASAPKVNELAGGALEQFEAAVANLAKTAVESDKQEPAPEAEHPAPSAAAPANDDANKAGAAA